VSAVHSHFAEVAAVDETLALSLTALRDMLTDCDFTAARKLCAAMHVRCERLERLQRLELEREVAVPQLAGGAR
jgi:hypothetical protein